MTEIGISSNSKTILSPLEDPYSLYFIHSSDHHGIVLITPELTLSNYASWSHSFMLALSIKIKYGFIDGSIPALYPKDKLYFAWKHYNDLIVAWLLHSISPSITSTIFYIDLVAQI